LDDLLRESDGLSIHRTLSAGWQGLVDDARIRFMKPTASLIDTARGPTVEEAALIAALAEGGIALAGLDVFDEELLHPNRSFTKPPNGVLTPPLGCPTDEGH
jgi:phosphoglycerate dehydrogenase-like enzyme